MQPRASVVIPAHNEERVIARTLGGLLGAAEPGEFHVVVVCNGCVDETATVARRAAPDAEILELSTASKIAALNAGDAACRAFPRVYLDADVEVGTDDVRAVCAALADGVALAASPQLRLELSRSSWAVRSYAAIWSRLPEVRAALSGRGLYALSREGRARFGAFPEVIADDRFVNELFAPTERQIVEGASTLVRLPSTLPALVRRRIRVAHGNREVSRAPGRPASVWQWVDVVRVEPRLAVHIPAFLGVTVAARVLARIGVGRTAWGHDRTSRRA